MAAGPPRTIDRDAVERLRGEGLSYAEIARRLGCSSAGVLKAANPERAVEYARRDRARPGRREAKRESDWRTSRAPCKGGCGRLIWKRSGSGYCSDCGEVAQRARERTETIVRMWGEGATLREIATVLDSTKATVGVDIARLRKRGYDLPYRWGPARDCL